MKRALLFAALLPLTAHAADRSYVPGATNGPAGASPPYSAAVTAGNTVYVAGTTDGAVPGDTATTAARRVLDNIKRNVEASGLTMDDLVWVQVFHRTWPIMAISTPSIVPISRGRCRREPFWGSITCWAGRSLK